MSSDWRAAQEWERKWWDETFGSQARTLDELQKQQTYAKHMGLAPDAHGRIDLRGRSVLDVGGGPMSLLLQTVNGRRRVVVDPLPIADWCLGRYAAAGIEVLPVRGEDLGEGGWDENWLYNVLQHTEDPEAVLRNARAAARTLRVFEWLDTGISDGHLHSLSAEWFESILGPGGRVVTVAYPNGITCRAFVGVFGEAAMQPTPSRFRFHVPALPHVVTNTRYLTCAYTQKVRKLCGMLLDLGHEVYHYGCEGAEVRCTEDVEVVSNAYRRQFYADNDDDPTGQLRFDVKDEYHQTYYSRCVAAIEQRLQPGDFLLCMWGLGHKPIADALKGRVLTVEPGVGYRDTFADFRAFESYWHMARVYGASDGGAGTADGHNYDAVIPNFFDPAEFEFRETKGDYLLYLGRIIRRKGVLVAVKVAEELGMRLVMAGRGKLIDPTEGLNIASPLVEHIGCVGIEERRELLAGARALLAPTDYLEPFGGVVIEAAMSGTPAITTDWGAFTEIVLHGQTGWRCRTLGQFLWAVKHAGDLRPQTCRDWAMNNFSCERVGRMYQEYFGMVYGREGAPAWSDPQPERADLAWLTKEWPDG